MKESVVRVVIRNRETATESKNIEYDRINKTVILHRPRDPKAGVVNNTVLDWKFSFDEILQDASQEEVFEEVGKSVILSCVLKGYNATVMAYGQTGAGKTYTMRGNISSYAERGLVPRTILYLFSELQSRNGHKFDVWLSYVEIYNEDVLDLLDIGRGNIKSKLRLVSSDSITELNEEGEDPLGYTRTSVKTGLEALKLYFEGEKNRMIAQHKLNMNSTRSHCVLTLDIEMRSGIEAKVKKSKIMLVDLAGSERVHKTQSDGNVLKEACCTHQID